MCPFTSEFARPSGSYSKPVEVHEPTHERTALALSGRTILLATDGSPAAQTATRVAAALAETYGARPHLLGVIDTSAAPLPPPLDLAIAVTDSVAGPAVHEEQVAALRTRAAEATLVSGSWPAEMVLGIPAVAIVRAAARLDAALIVVGLRRHGVLDRAIHDETVLSIMRASRVPVLAVSEWSHGLPRHIVAAMDFGDTSVSAAHASADIVATDGRLVLAYVRPSLPWLSGDGEGIIHALGMQAAFDRTVADVQRPGIVIDRVALHHDPERNVAQILLGYADEIGADLICSGSARHSRVDRWMLGSVSTDLVRDGRHSVLVVPPRDHE